MPVPRRRHCLLVGDARRFVSLSNACISDSRMDVFELLAKVLFVAPYHVQTEFLCNIIKFIKRSKKIHRCSFDITLSIYKISTSNS
jgi:hypothetical protein